MSGRKAGDLITGAGREDGLPSASRLEGLATAAALAAAVAYRFWLYFFTLRHVPPSSDEAWPSLMAMGILKGEYPIVYWGQTYMGTQESYILAPLIAVFGPETWVVRTYPLLFGLLFFAASALLAARIFDRQTALITMALLAVPVPYVGMCGAMIAPDNYLAIVTLGSFSLLLLLHLLEEPPCRHRTAKFALLGLLLGYSFWLHLLIVSYIGVVLLILVLRDKLFPFRRECWAMAGGFIVGALPILWYNLSTHGATFLDVGRTASLAQRWFNLRKLFQITIHFLTGMKVMFTGDKQVWTGLPPALAAAMALVYIGLLAVVLVSRRRPLLRLGLLSVRPWDGTVMLVAMSGAAIYLFVSSTRSGWHDVRYVLPIVSALPILLAAGLRWVQARSRLVFFPLLGVLVLGQIWGNIVLVRGWSDPRMIAERLRLPDLKPLIARLDELGIRYAYAHFWISYRMTFETKERIVVSEPYNERFPLRHDQVHYLDIARTAPKAAYIWHPAMGFSRERFESLLDRARIGYRSEKLPPFTLYHDFTPPYGDVALHEVPRETLRATASTDSGEAPSVLDGDLGTFWDQGGPQSPGTWLEVALPEPRRIAKVDVHLGYRKQDYPRELRVDASADGVIWRTVWAGGPIGGMAFWEGTQPRLLVYGDYFTLSFPPLATRRLRLVLTGSGPREWAVAELRLHAAD